MKRLRGYGKEESHDDWELTKAEAFCAREIALSGEELVGDSRSGLAMVTRRQDVVIVAALLLYVGVGRKPSFEVAESRAVQPEFFRQAGMRLPYLSPASTSNSCG